MRRLAAILAILSCVLLCGCSGDDAAVQPALDFRTSLLNAGGCTFSADVTADYGEDFCSFSADCAFDGKDGTITVTAPEEIEGISASISGETAQLSFDGLTLALDDLGEGHAAPLTLPWLFGSAWKSDYISSVCKDGSAYRVTILKGYGDDTLQIDTWLEGGIPLSGEVSYQGSRLLAVTFRDFSFN